MVFTSPFFAVSDPTGFGVAGLVLIAVLALAAYAFIIFTVYAERNLEPVDRCASPFPVDDPRTGEITARCTRRPEHGGLHRDAVLGVTWTTAPLHCRACFVGHMQHQVLDVLACERCGYRERVEEVQHPDAAVVAHRGAILLATEIVA